MTDAKKKDTKQKTAKDLQSELTERGRDVWLAGLGALATVEEEGTKLFNNLVDRGRSFESKRRKEIEEAREQAEKQGSEVLSQLEEASEDTRSMLTNAVDNALQRFNVPTQKEVDKLSKKVDALGKQIDTLTKALREGDDKKSK